MPIPINISASTGAAILQQSKYQTAVQNWLRIMESRQPGFCARNGYEIPPFEESAAIRFGKAFESAVIELAEQKQAMKIIDRERVYSLAIAGQPDAISCHIDGMYDFDGRLHEGKTTNVWTWKDNFAHGIDGEPDRVMVEYLIQANHQMICAGSDEVIMSVLVFPKRQNEWEDEGLEISDDGGYGIFFPPNREKEFHPYGKHFIEPIQWAHTLNQMGYFHQYHIKADPVLQSLMLEQYEKFWRVNVIGQKMPDLQDMVDVKSVIKNPVGTVVLEGDSALLAKEAIEIAGEERILKARKEKLKIAIIQTAKDGEKHIDESSENKFVFLDEYGKKLASYAKSGFRWAKG